MGKRTDAQRFIAHLCHIGSRFLRRQAAGYIRKFIHTGEEPPLRPSRDRNRIAIADKKHRPSFNPTGSVFDSDRKLSRYALPERLYRMGEALRLMDRALTSHDQEKIQSLLTNGIKIDAAFEKADGYEAMQTVCALLEKLNLLSDNIREYGSTAVRRLSGGDEAEYSDALLQFRNTAPDWEAWLENLLVNHMFFHSFRFRIAQCP